MVDDSSQDNQDPPESILDLSEHEENTFNNTAKSYGVEINGGTPTERKKALKNHLSTPITIIDARNHDTADDIIKQAIEDIENEEQNSIVYGRRNLSSPLVNRDMSLAILEFDSLPMSEQQTLAQNMKGTAETISSDKVMFGYTAENEGTLVTANPDLQMRIKSYTIIG